MFSIEPIWEKGVYYTLI